MVNVSNCGLILLSEVQSTFTRGIKKNRKQQEQVSVTGLEEGLDRALQIITDWAAGQSPKR
jgi:predicted RNA-binding protein with RPS1 domain